MFFDPESDLPKQMDPDEFDRDIMEALLKSGAPPEVVYAHKKTGRLGIQGMMDNWPEDARREWEEAIDEFFRLENDAEKRPKS